MNVETWRLSPARGTGTMRIAGVASAFPEHRYPQAEITAALKRLWKGQLQNPALLDRLHARVGVDHRHLALPLERYAELASWGEMNVAWIAAAQDVGARAIDTALMQAGLRHEDVDALIVVSVTGIASPSLDARLINRLGLRPDVKRTPMFGVGCSGGAIGLTRAADYTLAYPGHVAVLLAVELCSLTLQRGDLTTANLVSTGLFGDGAAAAIVAGAHRPSGNHMRGHDTGPRIVATRSVFYPETEDIMGWDISGDGFKIVLSPHLPQLIRDNLARDVDAFLADHALQRADIDSWAIHTGGPKVLLAIQEALALDDRALAPSWDCLRRVGNLSSASVLCVLEDIATNRRPPPGTSGFLLAMGPGFCSELILLQW